MNCDGFLQCLMVWAPTIWYTTGFLAFWFGSGAFVYRAVMRAFMSSGIQRLSDSPHTKPLPFGDRSGDRSVWIFSTPWALLISGILGPIGAFLLAVVYYYGATAWTKRQVRKTLVKQGDP